MFLVDDLGRIIDKDTFTALIALILFKKEEGTTLYAPVSASGVLEKIAEANKGSVVRTKTSDQDLMNKLMDSKNGNKEQFLLHFDSFNAVARIIDFMYKNKLSLSQLIDMIPDFHISSKVVKCQWEAKGKVIRELMQQEGKSNKIETLEGVKIFKDKSWVLVLPDAEKPYCNVISESYNQEIADELTGFYSERIQKLSKK